MPKNWIEILTVGPAFLLALCIHEFAHAWVAARRGDPTPREQGRLTLNPAAHLDLWGTVVLPLACLFYGFPFFGWAKPVPIDERNFKAGRRDVALVAAAGPVSNLLLAVASTLLLGGWIRWEGFLSISEGLTQGVERFCVASMQVNLMLALFNLIPVPPLDGFMAAQSFLPRRTARSLSFLAPIASLALVGFLMTGGSRYLTLPTQACFRYLLGWIS